MYYLNNDEVDPNKLFQGDIFEAIPCPFLQQTVTTVFREDGEELVPMLEDDLPDAWQQRDELILVRARKFKVILLSQTCDIHEERHRNLYLEPQEKYDCQFILYAPLIPVNRLDEYPRLHRTQNFQNQNLPGAFWLPSDAEKSIEESVVYFHLVGAILKRRENRFQSFHPKRRLASLMSPHREALASKFAFMISRVALPSAVVFTDNRLVAPAP